MTTHNIEVGTRFELTVERPAFGGDVIGTAPDGRIVFLRGVAPGDFVSVEVSKVKKRFLRGRVLNVRPGVERQEPFCVHFESCGGCPWQAIPPGRQREAIETAFERSILRFCESEPEVGPIWFDDRIAWRSTTRLRWQGDDLGYYSAGSHALVDVEHCPVLAPPLPAIFKSVREHLHGIQGAGVIRLTAANGATSGTVVIDLEQVDAYVDTETALGRLFQSHEVHGATLRCRGHAPAFFGDPNNRLGPEAVPHPAAAFVQAHQTGSQQLVADVLGHLEGSGHVLELYAGSGNFTFSLGARGTRVTAVEVDTEAVGRMEREIHERGLAEVITAVPATAEDAPRGEYDAVLLDPPRSGAKEVLPFIHGTSAKRLVYVSCDQATLARDLRWLQERRWTIVHLRTYDLFPHSGHAEAVAVCRRQTLSDGSPQ